MTQTTQTDETRRPLILTKENSLFLTMKKQYFDMIFSGKKKEEYREIKPYWESRLNPYSLQHKEYIVFKNGYQSDAPMFIARFKGCKKGLRNPLYTDQSLSQEVFIIKIGEILTDTAGEEK